MGGFQNRATPLAAGGGTRGEAVGGVVLKIIHTAMSIYCNHADDRGSVIVASKSLNHTFWRVLRLVWIKRITFAWVYSINMCTKHKSREARVYYVFGNDIVANPLMLNAFAGEPRAYVGTHCLLMKRRRRNRNHILEQLNGL